jgi:signal transduction histidine kinase
MADAAIRVLLIEDDPDDYVLTSELLSQVQGQRFEVNWEQTFRGGLDALARGEHDVCLVDHNLGEHTGVELLRAAADGGRAAPIIMLTGSSEPQTDTAALRAGADDFLAKGSIDPALLDRSIRYAIERRRLERGLLESQKLESLGVLAGGIAHNFNNLLMVMLGNAERALTQLPPDSPARPSLERVEVAGTRAAELARDMLAYSGLGVAVVGAVDLPALVEETGRLVAAGFEAPVEITYRWEAALPPIVADATQIRQVVLSLVTNAAEALGSIGGAIEIRADVVAESPGDGFRPAGAGIAGPYVRLEIEDGGVGMASDTLDRLFEPFFTTKFTGRGLGLAAVLGIVRSNRGAIRFTSELGAGTVATLLFPCAG